MCDTAPCAPQLSTLDTVLRVVQGLWGCESSESSEPAHSLTIPRVSRYIVTVWTVCGREECDGRGVTVVSRHLAELPATGLNQHSDGRVEVFRWPPPPTSSRFTSHSCAGVYLPPIIAPHLTWTLNGQRELCLQILLCVAEDSGHKEQFQQTRCSSSIPALPLQQSSYLWLCAVYN